MAIKGEVSIYKLRLFNGLVILKNISELSLDDWELSYFKRNCCRLPFN